MNKIEVVGASISERLVTVSRDVDPNAALPALYSMGAVEYQTIVGVDL